MTDSELAKDLGPLAALTIGVGTMIGAGIFVLPGPGAAAAGPAVALSFVIGGVIALFTAVSASELGTAMPKAGGSYYYVNHALGPLFGSIAGWGNWMGLAFASAFYTLGFGQYLGTFLPIPPIGVAGFVLSPIQIGALAAGLLFVGVNYVGAKETGRIQNLIVVTLVGILTVFTVLGALQADLATLQPFFPAEVGGAAAVLPATALVFVSFLGFAKITTVAEEIKDPGRNLPLAVIGSVVIVTAMYALIMVVLMSVQDWSAIAEAPTPLLDVARIAFGALGLGGVGVALLTFAGLLATASSANASILASSRINFAMGRDRLVSDWLNAIHPTFATPHRSIAATGAVIIAFVVAGDVATLAKAGSVLHLIVYGLLNVALIVMREADVPDYEPEFRAPLYPLVPLVGAVSAFGLIAFMEPIEILLAGAFVVAGVVWYLVYARRHAEKAGLLLPLLRRRGPVEEPAAAAADGAESGDDYRVVVALADPAHEEDLIELASTVAAARDGTVVAVHVVTVPDQTALAEAERHVDEIDATSQQLLDDAEADAATHGVPVETHTVLSHRGVGELYDAARQYGGDLLVMGWGERRRGRAEGSLDELTGDLPCDVALFKDRGFDPSRILLPTTGGPDVDLGGELVRDVAAAHGSQVEIVHVAEAGVEDAAEEFLEQWGVDHGLGDAERTVATGDPRDAITTLAHDHSMLVMGATGRGVFRQLVGDTFVADVVDDVDCSVLLTERARQRSLRERLFGRLGGG